MTYVSFLALVLVALIVPGALAQGGYHRPGSQSDQPWLRSMDLSQSRSYSRNPQGYDARQDRNRNVIEAKRQRSTQQTYASAAAAMDMADQALRAGNRAAAWNVLNSARNALEGLQRADAGNPLWAIGLAELYACESYPKPDRAQYYIDQAIIAASRGAPPGLDARIARAKSLIGAGRKAHRNAIRPSPYASNRAPDYSSATSSSPSYSNPAAQEAAKYGDSDAARRLEGGTSTSSDRSRYGRNY